MKQALEQLVKLSTIDKEISSYSPKIEEENQKLVIAQSLHDSVLAKIQELEQANIDLKLKIKKNELHIDELSSKLELKKAQSASLKTEREIQSINIEMDIAKEQINFANEEIERLNNHIEENKAQIQTHNEEKEETQKNLDSVAKEVKKVINDIDKSRKNVEKSREKVKNDVNEKVISFYEQVKKWAGDSAIVPVKRKACYGCHIIINEQTHSALLLSDEIITCQSCGRILYIDDTQEATAS